MTLGLMHRLQVHPHVARCFALTYMDGLCGCDVPIEEDHSIRIIEAPIGCANGIKASTRALGASLHVGEDCTHLQHEYHRITPDVPIGVVQGLS